MRRLNPVLVHWLQDWADSETRRIGLEFPGITQEGKLLHSPGRSTRRGVGPNYEPNAVATRVKQAIEQICSEHKVLLVLRYQDGIADWLMAKRADLPRGKVRWALELAHRDVAKELKIQVYR